MFFFLTLFIQDVWGYSPLKTGVAYLQAPGPVRRGPHVGAGR